MNFREGSPAKMISFNIHSNFHQLFAYLYAVGVLVVEAGRGSRGISLLVKCNSFAGVA